ncbi:unnamed protein product [Staurois parvus]|uniref:Uncharacterized protein n=1 Tax=Staurois parvus TaxID=386267 RepID=A0ABN9BUC6_9NEOB|nr:unnamed protein product [Staurois parvus]
MLYGRSGGHWLQGVLGLLGTVALMVSVLTSQWYNGKGLWDEVADKAKATNQTSLLQHNRVHGAQRFFAGLSFIMAAAGSCICLVYLFCLRPPRHPHHTLRMPNPGSLLLAVLPSTGFFFSVAWTIFTWQHREVITANWTRLGFSYWLGGLAWTSLLLLLPILYLVEECAIRASHKPLLV